MDTNKFEKLTQEMAAVEAGGSSDALQEVLSSTDKVRETIRTVGENGGSISQASSAQRSQSGLASISQKISRLLFSHDTHSAQLPTVREQRKQVRVVLEKEKNQLLKEASRIESRRNFSAAALEEVIRQIRYLQQLLAELIQLAAKKLEQLYRHYVLRGRTA
ncbi:hypothetical protein K9L63_03715 [Candidatus Gracilibacteria bacterium]|nr:hypothetical protein [Candidatus Gracilibacteria bacterium]